MALSPYRSSAVEPVTQNITTKEFAIGGKLLAARLIMDPMVAETISKEQIKERLAIQLAMKMIDDNLIEFTKHIDNHSFQAVINARCYVASDSQVKILRMYESSFNNRG